MENRDHDFENFLREFAPSQPRALPDLPVTSTWNWQRLAAAAVLAISCGSAIWLAGSHYAQSPAPAPPQSLAQNVSVTFITSTVYLQRLALEDPAQFEAALAAASQNTLPRFDGPNSSLRVLAKD